MLFSTPCFGQPTEAEQSLNAQLLVGARNNDVATVRRALEKGAAPDARNRAGDTALMVFARKGDLEMAQWLLDKGASADLRNLDKVTPLMAAAYHGHATFARLLLLRGAERFPVEHAALARRAGSDRTSRDCTAPAPR